MRAEGPAEQAARWYARLLSGMASESEQRACAHWRAAHPEHERAFRHLERIWQATQRLPAPELRAILLRRDASASPAPRRGFLLGLAGACAVGLGGVAAWGPAGFESADYTTAIASGPGQRRVVALPDGTLLEANTRTDVLVRYYGGRRTVNLMAGECYLRVARDDGRPFDVRAGDCRVSVEDAALLMRVVADEVQIHVEAGQAEVAWGPWWQSRRRMVGAGQGLVVSASVSAPTPQPVALDAVLAWRQGRLAFNTVPLAQVVDEINRYLVLPAWLDAPSLQDHPVSGVLETADPQALVDALVGLAPVRVYRLPDGQPRIIAR